MKTTTAILSALALTQQATAVVDKWTPQSFDWDSHVGRYGCATQNVTANPPTKDLVVHANVKQGMNETDLVIHERFPIAITLGAAVRVAGWLTSAGGAISTAIGCWEYLTAESKEEETTAASRTSCVLGLASTVLGFGCKSCVIILQRYTRKLIRIIVAGLGKYIEKQQATIAALRAAARPPQLDPVDLGAGFRDTMELAGFGRRAKRHADSYLRERGLSTEEEYMQYFHDDFTANMIRDAKLGEGEFLGYANDTHPLSKRDGVHALVPRFSFEHPKHGSMVLATRFTNETMHVAVEPHVIGNPKVHKRYQEKYRAEVLDNHRVLEGRFDVEAAQADPGNPTVDAAEMFGAAEDTLHCMFGDNPWDTTQLIDMQFYDDSNRATAGESTRPQSTCEYATDKPAGYASIGVFDDQSHDGDLSNTMPQPPITGGEDC